MVNNNKLCRFKLLHDKIIVLFRCLENKTTEKAPRDFGSIYMEANNTFNIALK